MKENNKIFPARIKHMILCIGLAVCFLSITIPASVSFAERRVKGEWVLPKHYPDGFDGWGRIDRITEDTVVIDDTILKLYPYAKYCTPTTKYATSAYFSPGNLVGYVTNSENEIISLWLIKE